MKGQLHFVTLGMIVTCFLAGCVAPPTFKVRSDATAKMTGFHRVVIVPPEVEVNEISAGGITEQRDDWSKRVSSNLASAIANATGFIPVSAANLPTDELKDIQALLHTIAINHISFLFAPGQLSSSRRPLTYAVGPIDRLASSADQADAVLFVYGSDAHSTRGRKALVALGFAPPAGALTSAALVARDGTVEWFNYCFDQQHDMREMDGARAVAQALLAGLPREK